MIFRIFVRYYGIPKGCYKCCIDNALSDVIYIEIFPIQKCNVSGFLWQNVSWLSYIEIFPIQVQCHRISLTKCLMFVFLDVNTTKLRICKSALAVTGGNGRPKTSSESPKGVLFKSPRGFEEEGAELGRGFLALSPGQKSNLDLTGFATAIGVGSPARPRFLLRQSGRRKSSFLENYDYFFKEWAAHLCILLRWEDVYCDTGEQLI